MSKLVVDLTNPESVALARQVLEMLGNDWPSSTASQPKQELAPWEGPDPQGGLASRESDSKADDADPWATSASEPETPRAADSGPRERSLGGRSSATSNSAPSQAVANATDPTGNDDDDPWS